MASQTDIDSLLRALTLEEKVSLLAGQSFWGTRAIPDKGIPSVALTDGPNGTRGARLDGSTRAACFPAAVALASTFDGDIAERTGRALAEEAATKGARCLLAPTVCIQRHPLGGRNFETYSEDPFLSGTMAARMIAGIQATGTVAATIKHFVANEQESCRTTVDSRVSERALREIYLRPFEIAIKSAAPPYAVMTSYNRVNGTHSDDSAWLLSQVLRGDWRWEGLVMSDWGGTNSMVAGLNAGLDLEMPGPPRVRTAPVVLAAVEAGDVSPETIDARARAVLAFLQRVGAFGGAADASAAPEGAVDRPEHRRLIRDAGSKGVVLLKNDNGLLPLAPQSGTAAKTIALIGLSKDALAHGGGSASVRPHYKISPWEALHEAFGGSANFVYAKGFRRVRLLPALRSHEEKPGEDVDVDPHPDTKPAGTVYGLDGKPGLTLHFYDADADGHMVGGPGAKPTSTIHGHVASSYSPLGTQDSLNKVVEIVGDFVPSETGNHCLACSGIGPTQVFVDDALVFDQQSNAADPMGALFAANTEPEVRHRFVAGQTYRLRICTRPPANLAAVGLPILEGRSGARLGFVLASDRDSDAALLAEAAAVAAQADVAIVFTGHDPQWETEGRDQDSFHLPLGQDALVEAVAAAAPAGQTVVVNCTGTPVAMPWLSRVGAVLQAWFLGQECGNALADVLSGAANPEGHLPVSFPRRIEDAPAHGHFGAEVADPDPAVDYAEGVFVGYRFYDQKEASLLNFPFGHGLSYSTFGIGIPDVVFDAAAMAYTATASVSNTGALYGGVALQLYLGRSAADGAASAAVDQPRKTLVAYQKVRLEPGASQAVVLKVAVREAAYFDNKVTQKWIVESGEYSFSWGFSATDIRQVKQVHIAKQYAFGKEE